MHEEAPKLATPTPPPARVLVVDDHPVVLEGLTQIINARPELTVCGTATSVQEARTSTATLRPELVVLDLSLTDASGLDLIEELSAVPNCTVVVYSQFDRSDMRKKSKARGASAFLSKKAKGDELAELLVSLCSPIVEAA